MIIVNCIDILIGLSIEANFDDFPSFLKTFFFTIAVGFYLCCFIFTIKYADTTLIDWNVIF